MKQFLIKTQKVKATCIVRSNGKVLLLRSDQVVNPEHQPRGGYFDIPSFTVPFGGDPEATLQNKLAEYFNQVVEELSMIDMRHYLTDDTTTQVFEVVYMAQNTDDTQSDERYGKFLFVEEHNLDAYMFPQERAFIEKYLQQY